MSTNSLSSTDKINALKKAEKNYVSSSGMAIGAGEGRDIVITKQLDRGKNFKEVAKKVGQTLQANKNITQDKNVNSSAFEVPRS